MINRSLQTITSSIFCWAALTSVIGIAASPIELVAQPPQESVIDTNQDSPSDRAKKSNQKQPTIYWPKEFGVDTKIITPKEFFGFEIGHRHLRHDQVVSYMRKIAEVSDRVSIIQYGQTHGGRPLLMLTITSPENHGRIDEIRKRHRLLTKPERSDNVAIDDLPAVMNMGYGVHGDEPSATNTSPLVAHFLASAQGPEIDRILKNTVVLLDPSLNPDGFDRFARWANTFRGNVPNADPSHMEHNQGWPAGRVNYYWFDLNRDWLPAQHPESHGRLREFHKWKPNVVLDFHEMGTGSTFFFQPGIPSRTNPLTPFENIQLTREIAKFHAKDLDQLGSLYFTQEVFDDFYMGKGSTYPDLHGSIGILFEQGSSRGHVQESPNGVIRFSDTIRNQFTASVSSLRAATSLRKKLLTFKRDFYVQSVEKAGQHPIKTYVFQAPNNKSRLQSFADILLRHDIRCYWLKQETQVGERKVSAGSLVVPTTQPEYRFLRSLIERRKKFQESVFYDVSAWTLPLAFNLKQINLESNIHNDVLQLCKIGQRHPLKLDAAAKNPVAYFIDWRDDAAPQLLQTLLAEGAKVRVARKELTVTSDGQSKAFSFGTLSVPMGVNKPRQKQNRIKQILARAARRGVNIFPVDSGLAQSGIDLGSNNFPNVSPQSVALIVGPGTSAYQAGQVWHQLDHRIGMPVTLFEADRLARADLTRYTTIILVGGASPEDTDKDELARWVRRGGTLIGISRATSFVEQEFLGTSAGIKGANPLAARELAGEESMPRFVDARSKAALALVSGAIFNTQIDNSHPLLYGFDSKLLPVFRGSTSLLANGSNDVASPVRYTQEPLLAGYASMENQQLIAGTSAVSVHTLGQGRVILMIDDPNFRAFWPATSRMFMNAIFFGPLTGGGR